MNLLNIFTLKDLLDSIPGIDYCIENNELIVDYYHDGSCTEFVFYFDSVSDLPF